MKKIKHKPAFEIEQQLVVPKFRIVGKLNATMAKDINQSTAMVRSLTWISSNCRLFIATNQLPKTI
jgi:hypothetical protein